MSWSINAIGTTRAIKARIEAAPYLPEVLKTAAKDIIDRNPPGRLIHLQTHGHVDSTTGAVGEFSIKTVELAPEPAPEPAAAPATGGP